MKSSNLLVLCCVTLFLSCAGTKFMPKNVDENAPALKLTPQNTFIISEYSTDKRYGYEKDYPINIFYKNTKDDSINQLRFLNALAGPKGEKIFFRKLESCCPFSSAKSEMGAGFLDVYEITYVGQQRPIKLYMNIYEKGVLMVPVGFMLKQDKQIN